MNTWHRTASRSGDRPPHGAGGARWLRFGIPALVTVVVLLLYGHTLGFPFVFDDCVYLATNPFAFGEHRFGFLTDPIQFATMPSRLGMDPDYAVNIMLRPLAYLTFYWNYLAGGLEPQGYRAVNIAIHAVNGCLVFALLRQLLLGSSKRSGLPPSSAWFIPSAAALLYAVHPLHTESVTYVVQRFTSMGALFSLLTILFHLAANAERAVLRRRLLRTASWLAALLGMLSKESVFTAPAMAVLLDWLVIGSPLKVALRRAGPLLASMIIVPALVLFTAWAENGGDLSLNGAINIANRERFPIPHLQYVLTEIRVVLRYLGLILLPVGQNADPDVDWSTSWTDARVLASAAVLGAIVAGAFLFWRRRTDDLRRSLVLAFVIYYFVALVTSSGLAPLPDAMAEHRTYKPSIGILTALVVLFDFLRTRWANRSGRRRWVAAGAVAVWACALGWATLERNEVWRTELGFWQDAVRKSPAKWRPLANLGAVWAERGNLEEARRCFEQVLWMEPRAVAVHANLAATLNLLGRHYDAREVCLAAIDRGINTAAVRHNLGLAECSAGMVEQGTARLLEVVRDQPDYRPSHVVLGIVFLARKHHVLALQHLRRAHELGPPDPEIVSRIEHLEARLDVAVGRPGGH